MNKPIAQANGFTPDEHNDRAMAALVFASEAIAAIPHSHGPAKGQYLAKAIDYTEEALNEMRKAQRYFGKGEPDAVDETATKY